MPPAAREPVELPRVRPAPAVAVQAAIWDAEASAGAEGLYTCQLVG